jgi:hypothetical protein
MKQARSLSRRFIGGFLRRTLKNITLFCGFFWTRRPAMDICPGNI